jgi:hypothetical protein
MGQFFPMWLILSMRLVNTRHDPESYHAPTIVFAVLLYGTLVVGNFLLLGPYVDSNFWFSNAGDALFLTIWVLSIVWVGFALRIIWLTSKRIHEIQTASGSTDRIAPSTALLMTFLAMACVPYIQHHINGIIDDGGQKPSNRALQTDAALRRG